ncbi:MAG: Ig-like domain-containing protein [Candidatus Neomarinimicrobiota bacterium]
MKNNFVSKFFIGIFALITFSMLITNCQKESEIISSGGDPSPLPGGKSIISGQVVSQQTTFPLDSALVRIFGTTLDLVLTTDSQGRFSFEVVLEFDEDLMIMTYRENYLPDTTEATLVAGEDLNVPIIALEELENNTGGGPTGDPVSIFLSSISSTTIGVKESGSPETTQLSFVVQDSTGRPIDLEHSVTINFRLGSGPGGGEFLSPYSVPTNSSGQAAVSLTSGTKAGTVQVIAEIDLGSEMITSIPVAIAIHGGLPDYTHFSIAPVLVNFPGYNIFGVKDQIVAFVGDKYANPVRPETAVYFTTTGGIIEGSTLTDAQGIGSVALISAEPRPFHETLGAGFGTVTASTVDENSAIISRETIVLFSGVPQVSITPTSINVPNGGSQSFSYYVGDQNGNPLAGGTSVQVLVEGDDVDAQGDLGFVLPDTQSPAWTQFNFLIYDTADTIIVVKPVTIRIQTTGPNGGGFITISGIGS